MASNYTQSKAKSVEARREQFVMCGEFFFLFYDSLGYNMSSSSCTQTQFGVQRSDFISSASSIKMSSALTSSSSTQFKSRSILSRFLCSKKMLSAMLIL